MDDSVLATFQSAFTVSGEAFDRWSPYPHHALYKQKREGYGTQEARRRRLLEEQKSRRRDYSDHVRKVVEGEAWEEDGDEGMEEGGVDEVDTAMEVASRAMRKKRLVNPYRNQIMLSEWMVDVPDDLQDNWLFVVCPIGQRCLVVASRATTTAYSRSGHFLRNFPSLLPGGSKKTHHTSRDNCILDCIYHEASRTFFIVDVMCWRGHPVYDSDTEFRFYWLKTKLSEDTNNLSVYSRINPYKFLPLDSHSSSHSCLAQVMGAKWPLAVDGLLFFHKQAHYTLGHSPLVLWLKPHMVTDILGVAVSQEFLDCSPVMSSDVRKMDTAAAGGVAMGGSKEGKMDTGAAAGGVGGSKEGKMDTGAAAEGSPGQMAAGKETSTAHWSRLIH